MTAPTLADGEASCRGGDVAAVRRQVGKPMRLGLAAGR